MKDGRVTHRLLSHIMLLAGISLAELSCGKTYWIPDSSVNAGLLLLTLSSDITGEGQPEES